jgi:hypothetical protein
MICNRPPKNWYCTRDKDHEGPCATWPRCNICEHPLIQIGSYGQHICFESQCICPLTPTQHIKYISSL